MSSSYRMELDKWLLQLDVNAGVVYDIGGSQLPVKGRTKSWKVQYYSIGDLEDPHIGSPKPDFVIDLNQDSPPDHDLWTIADIIFCLEVFDYIWNPYEAFNNISYMLKDGGTAWISFPSMYPLHQPIEDDALRYMPGGIKKLAEAAGLKIVQMIPRKTETDAIYQAFRTERMRAAKHEDHNISGWIVELCKQ